MDDDATVVIREQLQALSRQLTPDAAGREARVQAGLLAYERARADGLCHEGAWECACEALHGMAAEAPPEQG